MPAKRYPVFFVKTWGSDDFMASADLRIAAKSAKTVTDHFDTKYYGKPTSVERIPGVTSTRKGVL
jgi:hypothetical protein